MIRLVHPYLPWWGLATVVLAWALFALGTIAKRRALRRFLAGLPRHGAVFSSEIYRRLAPGSGLRRDLVRMLLLSAALLSVFVALSRPKWSTRERIVLERSGIDVLVALDVSLSMLAEDMAPSRIAKAKHEVETLMERLGGDRIGLVVFSGSAHTRCPLTLDYGAMRMVLNAVDVGIVQRKGTKIGLAIREALRSFARSEAKSKVLIIITDGDDDESGALDAAKAAASGGIVVHCIGIGAPRDSFIPLRAAGGRPAGYKKDRDGNMAATRLDRAVLEKIALETGGLYHDATAAETEISRIHEEIQKMEKDPQRMEKYANFKDQFQWFLLAAILLLLLSKGTEISEALSGRPSVRRRQA